MAGNGTPVKLDISSVCLSVTRLVMCPGGTMRHAALNKLPKSLVHSVCVPNNLCQGQCSNASEDATFVVVYFLTLFNHYLKFCAGCS